MTTARQGAAAAMTEESLIDNIIDLARYRGYLACHFRPCRKKDGKWATPVQGDKGFPDILIAGKGRFLVIEGKTEAGQLTADQKLWIPALEAAGVDVRIWRPTNWMDIEMVDGVLK